MRIPGRLCEGQKKEDSAGHTVQATENQERQDWGTRVGKIVPLPRPLGSQLDQTCSECPWEGHTVI